MSFPAPLILPYRGMMPKIDPAAFIAPGAVIIGDVEIAAGASIWFGCVLRGDVNVIRIGENSNIQDGTVIHVAAKGQGTFVGRNCTVGHMALLHACTLADHAFVGMKAAVMDGAKINSYGMLAAGALLTPDKAIETGQIWAGSPAKFWRALTEKDTAQFAIRAEQYMQLGAEYLAEYQNLAKN